LQRLPGKYREPLVLCYLEGKTRDEAARQLGWSPGAVKGRLERGRDLLRARLTHRGVTLPAALLAARLSQPAATAAVPAPLVTPTVRAALAFARPSAAAGGVSAKAAALAEGVLRGLAGRLKAVLALVLALGVFAAGAGELVRRLSAGKQPEA